jgi:hypothetical protein
VPGQNLLQEESAYNFQLQVFEYDPRKRLVGPSGNKSVPHRGRIRQEWHVEQISENWQAISA